jgi:hypothetical protein
MQYKANRIMQGNIQSSCPHAHVRAHTQTHSSIVEKKEQEERDYNSIPDHSFDLIHASLACILSAIHQAAPQ